MTPILQKCCISEMNIHGTHTFTMSGRFHGTHLDQDIAESLPSYCWDVHIPTTPFPLQMIPFHSQHYCTDPPITLPPSGLTSHVQYQQRDDFPAQLSVRTLPSLLPTHPLHSLVTNPYWTLLYVTQVAILSYQPCLRLFLCTCINKLCNGTIPIHIQSISHSTLPVIDEQLHIVSQMRLRACCSDPLCVSIGSIHGCSGIAPNMCWSCGIPKRDVWQHYVWFFPKKETEADTFRK